MTRRPIEFQLSDEVIGMLEVIAGPQLLDQIDDNTTADLSPVLENLIRDAYTRTQQGKDPR